MPLGLSLSLLCARLLAQLGDPQQGAASGALWPLSGAEEHTGVRGVRRGQGLRGAAAGILRPAAPKAKDPGAGGWRRRLEICTSTLSGARCWGLQGEHSNWGSPGPGQILRVQCSALATPTTPPPRSGHALYARRSAPTTPSTPRAPPALGAPPTGRPPYSTWAPRKRMAQRTKHPCASTGLTEVAVKEGCQCFGSSCQRANRNNFHSLTTTLG